MPFFTHLHTKVSLFNFKTIFACRNLTIYGKFITLKSFQSISFLTSLHTKCHCFKALLPVRICPNLPLANLFSVSAVSLKFTHEMLLLQSLFACRNLTLTISFSISAVSHEFAHEMSLFQSLSEFDFGPTFLGTYRHIIFALVSSVVNVIHLVLDCQ